MNNITEKKIAIIGSGIGGAACAYYLNKRIPTLKVDVFEASERIGGRLLSNSYEGVEYELGAGFFHNRNTIISNLFYIFQGIFFWI